MSLLHLFTMPATVRAGLVGIAAATSVAALAPRAHVARHTGCAHVDVIGGITPRSYRHGPCTAARVRMMVISERVRVGPLSPVQLNVPLPAGLNAPLPAARNAQFQAQLNPQLPARLNAQAQAQAQLQAQLRAEEALARNDASRHAARRIAARDRGVRVLAAIAFFLIGLA